MHQELTYKVIGVFYDVYNELGHGFLESVYQKSLGLALQTAGLHVCWPIASGLVSRRTGRLLRRRYAGGEEGSA